MQYQRPAFKTVSITTIFKNRTNQIQKKQIHYKVRQEGQFLLQNEEGITEQDKAIVK